MQCFFRISCSIGRLRNTDISNLLAFSAGINALIICLSVCAAALAIMVGMDLTMGFRMVQGGVEFLVDDMQAGSGKWKRKKLWFGSRTHMLSTKASCGFHWRSKKAKFLFYVSSCPAAAGALGMSWFC